MRLLYLVSHPIQYQAPLLRIIAADPDIDLHVLFEHMDTAGAYFDRGFGTEVEWDVPLTEGYSHEHAASLSVVERRLDQADVIWVHGWDSKFKLRSLEAARRYGVPVLMRGENTLAAMPDGNGLRGVLKRTYLRWIFYRCWAFLCIGSDNRDYYRAHGVDDARLFDMPYAVDNTFFQTCTVDGGVLRQELGLAPDRPIILFAGKFQERKNPEALLDALHGFEAVRPYLLFVGDGERSEQLKSRAGERDDVMFLGFQNQRDLPSFYAMADVFVLPSEREPWGLAVNEAMASGTAVIATDQCGCAVDLINETCGRVVPAGDAVALRKALHEILGESGRAKSMGAAARERIVTWSFDEDVAGLHAALKSVASPPPQS